MKYQLDDTIAAIATAPGGAARGAIRLSGPQVVSVIERCFECADDTAGGDSEAPRVIHGHLALREADRQLPCTLHLWPTSHSYTRQPAGELHTVGSPPLLSLALKTLCKAGARLAEPGEFTLRAFLGGRIDLTQAEAVLGVIDAQDRRQLRISLQQMAGGLNRPLHETRARLLNLLADLEAGLDFVEEDIHFISRDQIDSELSSATDTLSTLLEQFSLRGLYAAVPRVVLVGPPNAGKSSLFNALVGSQSAIVSEQPGTTRDYLIARVSFAGAPGDLIDTAGMENDAADSIDAAAQIHRDQQQERADLKLVCRDASDADWCPVNGDDSESFRELAVWTKCDQAAGALSVGGIPTSSVTGEGIETLKRTISERLCRTGDSESAVVQATAERCQESMRRSLASIDSARSLNRRIAGEELVAAEIRAALDELGRVVGSVYTEDLLDRIFSRFCIGK